MALGSGSFVYTEERNLSEHACCKKKNGKLFLLVLPAVAAKACPAFAERDCETVLSSLSADLASILTSLSLSGPSQLTVMLCWLGGYGVQLFSMGLQNQVRATAAA